MAELKLLIERLSEREKMAIRSEIAQAEQRAEMAVLKAEEEAEKTLVEEKEKITNQLNNEFDMKKNTQDVSYRNAILREKQQVIQQAFKDALKELNNISENEFMKIVMTALSHVDVTQTVKLFVGEHTNHLLDREGLNSELPWNHHVDIIDEPVKNKAGVLVRQDNIDYNYFFDELIFENRPELLKYVTSQLFEE